MDKGQKNKLKANNKPILFLLAGLALFTAIIFITMLETAKGVKKTAKTAANVSDVTASGSKDASSLSQLIDSEMLAVVKEINAEEKNITLYNIDTGETAVLSYTGGTDITDKYGQVVTINKIPGGAIVDAGYRKEDNKLLKLQPSGKAWEYKGVKNLTVNSADQIMTIAKTKYQYTDGILILDEGSIRSADDLTDQDELTVWGINETIWSVTVTKGHGTVKLTDCDDFLGGSVTVGYEAMQQISEGMVITVREGSFNLTAENGQYTATKNITVYRNKETVVSLSNLGPDALKNGSVTFDITPFGADLYVDGELVNYANPIALSYGKHDIEVSLGGYTTYKGKINVDTAGKKITIELPESQSNDNISVAESGYDSGNSAASDEYNDWDNQTSSEEADNTDTEDSDSGVTAAAGAEDKTGVSGTETDTSGSSDSKNETVDKDHSVYVQNPKGASVYMDGKYMGISPGHFKKIIGNHVITFIKDGYQTKSYSVEILDDGMDTYYSLPDLTALK